ncbi:MAG: hypothetical protein JRM77_06925 [Nitrososphaerota archaeon]|nr:hypothetical protein [Nitrososphaerota archaeon]
MTSTAPTPKELSDRLEALRRTLRDSGKIGTESPENYELVSILNGIAALEGLREKSVKLLREAEDSTDYHNVGAFGISCYDKEKVRQVITLLEGTPEYRFEFEINETHNGAQIV